MEKKAFFLLLITLFINCSKDNEENQNIEPDQTEEALPVISISEFDNVIEKRTGFRVSVSGADSETNTKVLINNDELVSTSQKNFEFEINPFDYPNGQTVMTVKSVTSSNEESVTNEEFEIKKLLFRSIAGLSSESVDSYLAINLQSTGELVAFKKIITYDDPIFFHAEDNFIEEDIIITQYLLGANSGFHLARMYGNVKPGTELIGIQEVADELELDFIGTNNASSLNITLEGNTNSGLFSLIGRSYNFGNSSFPTFEIKYDEALTEDVFLYYFNQSNENILDNYRYAYIDNLTDQTLQFEEMSLLETDDIFTFELPETVERASISLFGFASENDYREDFFRLLFGNSVETETSGYSIGYPILEEYPIVVKSTVLDFLDGDQMIFDQRGTPDITIPDLMVQNKEGIIEINGEHDFSELNLEIAHPDPEKNDIFRMIYKNYALNVIEIPFETFEIPEEVVQIINERGLGIDTKDNVGEMELRITNYQNKLFPNAVFHFPLRREFGDAFYWTIPLEN